MLDRVQSGFMRKIVGSMNNSGYLNREVKRGKSVRHCIGNLDPSLDGRSAVLQCEVNTHTITHAPHSVR